MDQDQYRTIATESQGLFKEKGSKFIAIAVPVDSVEMVKLKLEQIIKQYHDARHHCYAYKIDGHPYEYRYNDDGEPSGTAGKPIYGQIESFGLTNLLIVVIRYFGGVKLGTGGLIQAYKSAAHDALEHSTIVIKTIKLRLSIQFPYNATNIIMRIIKEEKLDISYQEFTDAVTMVLSIRRKKFQQVIDRLAVIEGLQINSEHFPER
jgi:uncharacterized YigZ family protein